MATAFKEHDKDSDGFISVDDVRRVLTTLRERLTADEVVDMSRAGGSALRDRSRGRPTPRWAHARPTAALVHNGGYDQSAEHVLLVSRGWSSSAGTLWCYGAR
ncbi:hypothetical protein ACIBG6_38000 [Streptomyces sp. NPDC050842]|uniref:hypothetical protein n=1 Tax=Streptomyces sp. NPDC050842 TaxID=3365636 RepID=UPI0037925DB7